MHHDPEPPASSDQPAFVRPAVEDHGRVVTATIEAATFYRLAQRAVDPPGTIRALRLAIQADPGFGLAIADLDAISETRPSPIMGRQMNWERHHIEVVRTAAAGNFSRAADLLREQLASVGCDPLALRIVTDLRRRVGNPGGIEDLTSRLPDCHPACLWP